MGKRVGLLGLVLTVVLGCTSATSSASPTPLYAPEDMAFQIPSRVGEATLEVVPYDVVAAGGDGWREVLIPLRKEPSDVRVACKGTNSVSPMSAHICALRVDGVVADALIEPWYGVTRYFDPSVGIPSGTPTEWADIAGRRVLRVGESDEDVESFLYPYGEVLFAVTFSLDGTVTSETVLDLLPR